MADSILLKSYEGDQGSLPDIKEKWNTCLFSCPENQHLFTYEWFESWMRTYGSSSPWTGQSRILTAETREGEIKAVLPLAIRKDKGLTILSLAGFYQPVRGFVCRPEVAEEVSRLFVNGLFQDQSRWDIIRLGPFDTAFKERNCLLDRFQSATGNVAVIPRGRTMVNELASSFEEYEKSKSIKRTKGYEKKFLRDGLGRVKHFENPSGEELQEMLLHLRTVENNSWLPEAGGDLRFATEVDHAFWSRAVETALGPNKQLHIWIAYVGDQPGAYRVTLTFGSTGYMIANQYDKQFQKYRLGWILYLHELKYDCEEGIRKIDMAPGDPHYKGRWGGVEAELRMDVAVFPKTVKGFCLARAMRSLQRFKVFLYSTSWGRRIAARLPWF